MILALGETLTGTDIYQKLNDTLEKCAALIGAIVLASTGPGFVTPPLIQTLYGYYVTELGESAFTLAFPIR